MASSARIEQWILTGGSASSSAICVFLIDIASSSVLPFTHSVTSEDDAVRAQHASNPGTFGYNHAEFLKDVVQSIRTLTLLRQPHPAKRLEHAFHFSTKPEVASLAAAHPDLLAHGYEIADRCSFAFIFGKPQFPAFKPADGSTPAAFLRRLVMEGLRRRYPQRHENGCRCFYQPVLSEIYP